MQRNFLIRGKNGKMLTVMLVVLCLFAVFSVGVAAADWPSFRGNAENNGITAAKTPKTMADATLYWATKGGEGYANNAPSCPILVKGNLVYTAKDYIYALDTLTGEVTNKGKMVHVTAYNITPATYSAETNMIFVALNDGRIQAFDADTLKSLWVFQDSKGGQPNCPISYCDGKIYTGFWKSETEAANFVCINVTDEDKTKEDESKTALWTYANNGGYYWAGSYACEDYVLVGTDDGVDAGNATGRILSLNPATGTVIDILSCTDSGDIRSTVCYDKTSDRFFFTSKGGYLYNIKVNQDGTFQTATLKSLALTYTNPKNQTTGQGSCTSSPTVYKNRVYIGVQGQGMFNSYSGHSIAVIQFAEDGAMTKLYSYLTQGYPQTSALLTTAYEATENAVYVYMMDNYTPGKIRVIKDSLNQTAATSQYAPILFTPHSAQAQYAICSAICDEYGTIYFKNDSAYIMALGSTVDRIEITKQPDKTAYTEGEIFDPAGMQVTAYYKNGLSRDVTRAVSYMENGSYTDTPSVALSAEDTEIEVYFTHVLYQDADNGKDDDENKSGQPLTKPFATVEITVSEPAPAVDNAAVQRTIGLINDLKSYITPERVTAAKTAFNALTAAEKALVTNASVLTAAEQTVAVKPFTDVPAGWFYDAAYFAYWNGLISGTSPNTFAPAGITTRAQLVTILYRYDGSPATSGNTPFTDLNASWYRNAVSWAYQNNIVKGITTTQFDPDAPVTREQLAVILYRYTGEYKKSDVSKTAALSGFPDAAKVSGWAKPAVSWAVGTGLISGTAKGNLNYIAPQNQSTRAQIAMIMMRYMKNYR